MLHSKSGQGAGIAVVTNTANHVTITIPAGKGGRLIGVELQTETVDETVVCGGGLVRLHNTSADWDPFYFLAPMSGVVTAGGAEKKPIRYAVEKELPGNSTVYADYYPYDNQTQHLCVTLIWELGEKPRKETFSGYIHPLKAAAVTAADTRASPGGYAVPGGKGGRIVCFYHLVWPTLETIVQSGGLVEVENSTIDMTPTHTYTTAHQAVGAAGTINGHPDKIPWDGPCPQNSTFTTYYTPHDDQSQSLSTLIFWERPIRRVVA